MTDEGDCTRSRGILYGWIVVRAIWLIVIVSAGMFMSFGVFLNPLLQTFDIIATDIFPKHLMLHELTAAS
jgi:hypothetical protein